MRSLANQAALNKTAQRIGFADALAAALAKENLTEPLNGDPKFTTLEREIKIYWLTR